LGPAPTGTGTTIKKVTHFAHDFPFSMLPEPVWLKLNVREFKCILIAYVITVFFLKR
jgi:hypothetical protein